MYPAAGDHVRVRVYELCAGSRALKEEKTGKQGFTAATPAAPEQSITANGTTPVL